MLSDGFCGGRGPVPLRPPVAPHAVLLFIGDLSYNNLRKLSTGQAIWRHQERSQAWRVGVEQTLAALEYESLETELAIGLANRRVPLNFMRLQCQPYKPGEGIRVDQQSQAIWMTAFNVTIAGAQDD